MAHAESSTGTSPEPILDPKLVHSELREGEKCTRGGKHCCVKATDAYKIACGHRICYKCRDAILHNLSYTCPVEGDCETTELEGSIVPDVSMRTQLKEKQIYCPTEGCEEEIVWKELEEHLLRCAFRPLECRHEGCSEKTPRKDLEKHEQDCVKQPTECSKCKQPVTKASLQEHKETTCREFQLHCPNGCGYKLKRIMIEGHNKSCKMFPNPCSYREFGCLFMGSQQSRIVHKEQCSAEHLDLVVEAYKALAEAHKALEDKTNQHDQELKYLRDNLEKRPVQADQERTDTLPPIDSFPNSQPRTGPSPTSAT